MQWLKAMWLRIDTLLLRLYLATVKWLINRWLWKYGWSSKS